MNGKKLTRVFLDFIDTKDMSDDYVSQRRVYDCLDMASCIYARDTRALRSSVILTTVAGQQTYNLPPDFIDLYLQDVSGRFFVRYTSGSDIYWPTMISYDYIYRRNITDYSDYQNYFSIIDSQANPALVSGTATSAGASANGRCILADSTKNFLATDIVWPRDMIFNATDNSMGYVLEVIDATHLYTALFDGTGNDWTLSDSYTIQPASKKSLVLESPSLSAGHAINIPYVCIPNPLYWDFASWNFPERTCKAIASGAGSLFKIDKTEYKESQTLGALFDSEIKRYKVELGRQKLQQGPSRHRNRIL